MKSERSRAASAASSPSRSLWPVSMVCLPFGSSPGGRGASRRMLMESWMVFEVGSHALAQEHRVMALEDPFARPVAERPRGLVGLQLVERGVVRQGEQDDVVEVPAVRDVVPADEADAELVLVVLHLAREDRAHEELEERVAAAANSRSRKMIVWPVTRRRPMTAKSRTVLTAIGQFQATLNGVSTMNTTRTTTWILKQPRPGPRSASRSSPLYWTGPACRGRRGGVGSARGSLGSSVTRRNDTAGGAATRYSARRGSVASPSTTSTPGSARRIAGDDTTFHEREPPPSTIRCRVITRASTQ